MTTFPDETAADVDARLRELFEALEAARERATSEGDDATKPGVVLDVVAPALIREVRSAESWTAPLWYLAHLASEIVERVTPPSGTGSEAYQSVREANDELQAWLRARPPGSESVGTGTGTSTGTGTGTGSGSGGSGSSGGSGGGSGGGPTNPGDLPGLAAASASGYLGSAADRISFLTAARDLLATAEAPGGSGVPAELIPPITKVVLDVLDFIDRNLSARDLETLTGLKQDLAKLLPQSLPAIQATPAPLVPSARRTGR